MQATGWAQVSNFALVRALSHGTAKIDPYHWETKDESWYRGHYYSVKSPVLPALTLPVYAGLRAMGGESWAYETAKSARLHRSWRWRPSALPADLYGRNRIRTYHVRGQVEASTPLIWVLGLFGCVLPALVLMLLVRRLGDRLEPGYGAAAAVTLGLCTLVLPFSTLYFSHVLAACLGFAAFALLWRERSRPGGRLSLVALAGLLAGLAFASEYPLALGGAVLGAYAISRERGAARLRRGLAYAGGAVLGALPLFAYNLWAFGSLTHLSYVNAVMTQGVSGHDALGSNAGGFFGIGPPSPKVALDLLFAAKGLLVLAPVLAMSLVGVVLMARRGRRAEAWTIVALAGVYLVYDSGYWLPFGGGTPGPRFLMPLIPFLALPLALAWRRYPVTTFALAVPSALFMLTATLTFPLIGDDSTGFWKKLIDAANFEPTFFTPLGAGHGWWGIAPVLAAAALAALLAAGASRPWPRVEGDVRRAALAVVVWTAAAFVLPWLLGDPSPTGGQSAIGGDRGGGELIALFGGAGLASVCLVALLRRLRRPAEGPAPAPPQLVRETG
ncbi:MAG: hypothetical protein QOC77_2633 [Thermoleophilaceae bacterium]|nr:hypothetical protein [Thermoleophilaceae bacterium]MEA2469764.1 hypothetical protein [Thermoleophilaceae bacterium]